MKSRRWLAQIRFQNLARGYRHEDQRGVRLAGSVAADTGDGEGAGDEEEPVRHSHAAGGGDGGVLRSLAAQAGTREAEQGHVRGDKDGNMTGRRAGNTAVQKSHGDEHQDGRDAVGGGSRAEGRDVLPRDVAHSGLLFPGKGHYEVRLGDSESRVADLHPDV